jgi:tRNA(adenine34) deaminase
MRLALEQAEAALAHDDVPVGAVLVRGDSVIAAAKNERELRGDPTAHAEILVLQAGAAALGSWRLSGTSLYVTLEPCPMCAGALVSARVDRLVYGARDPKAGAAYSLYNIPQDPRLNHEVSITNDVLADECGDVLQKFFRTHRG